MAFASMFCLAMRKLIFNNMFEIPIWQLLDWFFGKGHGSLLRRAELKTLVDLHANEVVLFSISNCIPYDCIFGG